MSMCEMDMLKRFPCLCYSAKLAEEHGASALEPRNTGFALSGELAKEVGYTKERH